MARWMAWLVTAMLALAFLWSPCGCKRSAPKNINQVREEGRQGAPAWEKARGGGRAKTSTIADTEDEADGEERAAAAQKSRADQEADEKIRAEYKIDEETGESRDDREKEDEE